MTDDARPDPPPMDLDQARQIFPPCWVIYFRAAEFPTGYLVRVWYGMTPEPLAYPFTTVVEAREYAVASGASFPFAHGVGRESDAIVESWL